ncbi:unnamed protein product, partial [Medioppia subpectinata]
MVTTSADKHIPRIEHKVNPISYELSKDGITSSGLKFNEFEDKSLEEKEKKTINPKSVANVFIQEIIKFSKTGAKGTVDQPKGLMESDPQRLVQMLKSLCEDVKKLLMSESHCLSIASPVVVVGDIHGNIEDLLTIENTLSISKLIPTSKYLYLGDYVDRGKWSVECAVYLLSLKVLSPQNIHLLRGNHEVRELQEFFTFKEECTAKYGPQNRVYHLLNDVFDCLSVSAVVDDTIFCCHGGIPSSVHTIREIQAIPKPLRDPSAVECLPAHELLWNDPSTQESYEATIELVG